MFCLNNTNVIINITNNAVVKIANLISFLIEEWNIAYIKAVIYEEDLDEDNKCIWDNHGVLTDCYNYDVLEPPMSEGAFHTSYIKIPYPFRTGDVVRIVTENERLGIMISLDGGMNIFLH